MILERLNKSYSYFNRAFFVEECSLIIILSLSSTPLEELTWPWLVMVISIGCSTLVNVGLDDIFCAFLWGLDIHLRFSEARSISLWCYFSWLRLLLMRNAMPLVHTFHSFIVLWTLRSLGLLNEGCRGFLVHGRIAAGGRSITQVCSNEGASYLGGRSRWERAISLVWLFSKLAHGGLVKVVLHR